MYITRQERKGDRERPYDNIYVRGLDIPLVQYKLAVALLFIIAIHMYSTMQVRLHACTCICIYAFLYMYNYDSL